MDLRFYLDPQTGEPHIYEHGVSEEEVEEVLAEGDANEAKEPVSPRMGRAAGP
jgi:hypothetical protein